MAIPSPTSPHTLEFADALSPGEPLIWVDVVPAEGAQKLACIDVVDKLVDECGGLRILGWALWEWPEVMIEGEFHAVWQTSTGDIVDPTPKESNESRILFLPDPQATVDCYQKDNVRRPLRNRREISDFIEIKERIYRARNRGSQDSCFYLHTSHIDHLYSEERRIFQTLVRKFGSPPR